MAFRCRFLFKTFVGAASKARYIIPLKQGWQKDSQKFKTGHYVLGFSLFTWLGFDENKITPEDELINTIKHCVLFIQKGDHVKAEQLLHVGLRQAQQLHHEKATTYIYDILANLALEREDLDKAKQLFVAVAQRVMADGAKEDDPRIIHISAKLARISHLQKEYNTAQLGYDWCLDKLNTLLSRDPSIDNLKVLALTEDWYGRLYLDHGQYEHCLKFMISALDRMKLINDIEKEHIVQQLNDIGTVYDQSGNLDESVRYFQEAIELGNSIKMEDMGTMYVNLGRVYLKNKLIEQARKHCGRGWKLGVQAKNNDVKKEAELCLKEINRL